MEACVAAAQPLRAPGGAATHTAPARFFGRLNPHNPPCPPPPPPADYELIKRLEAARKVASAGFYKLKKKAIAAVAKATKDVSA